jgi:hypothetical protein
MSLKHPRAYLENTSTDIPKREKKNNRFLWSVISPTTKRIMGIFIAWSKFVLCPRGYACSRWRLFETMMAGRVPVIISDQWVPPEGPAWERFSVRVSQKHVAQPPWDA